MNLNKYFYTLSCFDPFPLLKDPELLDVHSFGTNLTLKGR